jgi:hypothetical protein
MNSRSIKAKDAVELEAELARVMTGSPGFLPTLAVVFLSNSGEMSGVQSLMKRHGIMVFGSSSGSEFVDGDIETASIVALLLDLNSEYFRLILEESPDGQSLGAAKRIGVAGIKAFAKPAFLVISGGLLANGDEIIDGLHGTAGPEVTIIGGLASDDYKMVSTYVFTADHVSYDGILSLVLNEDRVGIHGVAVGGWRPVGIEHVVTKSERNIVWTIDNEPAIEFIARYAGLNVDDLKSASDLRLSNNFQLQLLREDRNAVMRTPMSYLNEDKSIVFAGSMPEGSKVRLCLLPGFEVIQETLDEFKEYHTVYPKADAMIMFSCAGRQMCLGPFISEEIEGVMDIWESPMVGFFCYGEIGRVKGRRCEHHNMTCSLAILTEK